MESHECIGELIRELALDGLLVHILGYGVVDVKKCNDVLTYDSTDELGKTSVDINLAGYGNAHTC